jgi:hypothetical protein
MSELIKLEIMKTIIITIFNILLIINTYSQSIYNQSKILVHDYKPDIVLTNAKTDTLVVDIDDDSNNDIILYLIESSPGNWAIINTLNSNCSFSLICNESNIDTLNSDSINWQSCNSNVCWFNGTCDGFEKIAVKISKDSLDYFGWINVYFTMNNFWRVVIIDKYAFCTIPDYPLLWGQTELTGSKEIKVQDKVKVSVDGQSKSINIQSKEVVKEISLINSEGRVVQKWRNIKSSKVDISSEGIKGGVYLFRVKNMNNEVFTEKVVL